MSISLDDNRYTKSAFLTLLYIYIYIYIYILGSIEHPTQLLLRVNDTLHVNFCKTGPKVLDQAYHVRDSSLEEMLNSINSFFFRSLAYLVVPRYPVHTRLHRYRSLGVDWTIQGVNKKNVDKYGGVKKTFPSEVTSFLLGMLRSLEGNLIKSTTGRGFVIWRVEDRKLAGYQSLKRLKGHWTAFLLCHINIVLSAISIVLSLEVPIQLSFFPLFS